MTIPNRARKTGSLAESDAAVRALISEIIRCCRKSRAQIADEMNARLGVRVTTSMLNDFTSECKKAVRFPAAWVEAFCSIVEDDRLQRLLLSPRLRMLIELAERELEHFQSEREKLRLLEKLRCK